MSVDEDKSLVEETKSPWGSCRLKDSDPRDEGRGIRGKEGRSERFPISRLVTLQKSHGRFRFLQIFGGWQMKAGLRPGESRRRQFG
jgi:hypothetical protein